MRIEAQAPVFQPLQLPAHRFNLMNPLVQLQLTQALKKSPEHRIAADPELRERQRISDLMRHGSPLDAFKARPVAPRTVRFEVVFESLGIKPDTS